MDIEQFLAAQKESGQVESQGGFTIAVEKARQKLGQFQLDEPGFYLLKLVQAAVWAGASRIDVRTSRKKLALWFDAGTPPGPFDELWTALQNPLEARDGPFKLLALGFNAGMFSGAEQVCLVWWGADESRSLIAMGDELSGAASPPRPAEVSASENLYMLSVVKAQAGWFKSAMGMELDAVRARCAYCPVEIWVDGEPLLGGRPPEPTRVGWFDTHSAPFLLAERADLSSRGQLRIRPPSMVRRQRGGAGWLRDNRKPETFLWQPLEPKPVEPVLCSGAFSLPLGLAGADRLALIHHGVLIDSLTVHSNRAGAYAVLPADELTFDLSGFHPIRNERLEELKQRAEETWLEMLAGISLDLEHLTSTLTPEEKREDDERRTHSCGCGCFGALLTFLFCGYFGMVGDPLWLVGLGAGVFGGYLPRLQARSDRQATFRAAVRQRMSEVRQGWRD